MKRLFALMGLLLLSGYVYSAIVPATTDIYDYCTGANNTNCVAQLDSKGTSTVVDSSTTNRTFYPSFAVTASTNVAIPCTATYEVVLTTGNTSVAYGVTSVVPAISTSTAKDGQWLVLGSTTTNTVVYISTSAATAVIGDDKFIVISSTVNPVSLIYNSLLGSWLEVGKQ